MADVSSRELVLDMLLMVDRQEAYSHQIIKDVLDKYDYLSGQEKAFIKRLFEGTLERRIELDYKINLVSSVPVKKMKPLIRNVLRMGAYQILYMDSVPDSAAANEAVKLAAKRKFHNLKGFVNAILRKISAEGDKLMAPEEDVAPKEYLEVTYSMPEWIVDHFLRQYSYKKTKKILAGLMEVRPVTIRFASTVSKEEQDAYITEYQKAGIKVSNHPYVKEAYYLEGCENLASLSGHNEGAFTVQDASSMLAVKAAGIKPGDKVLDVCAAPGGKTMLAAEYATEKGFVEARDVSDAKVMLIEENISRMGLFNVETKVWDATEIDLEKVEWADVVIADVPCSGLGVMGKKRDIKYRQKEESLKELNLLQKEIVKSAYSYVKVGGTFLYSTCTINKEENEDMVSYICSECGAECVTVAEYVEGMPQIETAAEGYMQLLPGIHDTDGFFFAKFRKQ